MNTSPSVNIKLKLLRFIGIDIFFKVIDMVSSKVIIRNFKMLYFRNERYHATRWLKKDLLVGLLQPHIDKNSEDLATLILEFDESPESHVYVSVVHNAG